MDELVVDFGLKELSIKSTESIIGKLHDAMREGKPIRFPTDLRIVRIEINTRTDMNEGLSDKLVVVLDSTNVFDIDELIGNKDEK